MLDDKLSRIKKLISKREEVDAELSQLLGITERTKRGRPPKSEESNGGADVMTSEMAAPRSA